MAAGIVAARIHSAFPSNITTTARKRTTIRPNRIKILASASRPPLFLSTDPSHIDLRQLEDLYAACNLSGHRFPSFDHEGLVEPIDSRKLRIAVSNSSVVVSVFCRQRQSSSSSLSSPLLLFDRILPLTHSNGELIGFGRAVSDSSLTASIHDVMVVASLRRLGIGRMIVKRLVRELTRIDIYDIAAVCNKNERLFFGGCGFGDDMLNSTTMMYTRSVSSSLNSNQIIVQVGRKQLLV